MIKHYQLPISFGCPGFPANSTGHCRFRATTSTRHQPINSCMAASDRSKPTGLVGLTARDQMLTLPSEKVLFAPESN